MKNVTKIAAAVSLGWLCSATAFAAADAGVAVNGTITPAACDVTVGLPNGQVDYGVIPSSTLKPSEGTFLELRNFSVDVACLGETRVAVQLIDNRSDSVVDYAGSKVTYYGLGVSPGDAKIGRYQVNLIDAQGDGVRINPLVQGLTGDWGASLRVFNDRTKIAWTNNAETVPKAFKNLSLGLSLQASIAANQGMTFEENIFLDGSSVFEVVYL